MQGLTYAQTQEILDRLDFIKGNVIAEQQRDAVQQINELREYVEAIQIETIQKR